MREERRCGYIAIVGRSNVGKSTLLNRLLGKKISITSHKIQTTRHRILGIKTQGDVQAIYVDTPGIRDKGEKLIDRIINRAAKDVFYEVDIVVFMIDARKYTLNDSRILDRLKSLKCPVVLALNKVDLIKNKRKLLPLIDKLSKEMDFAEVIPLSIFKNINVDVLERFVFENLPKGDHLFGEDVITDRSDQFLVSEIIREKVIRVIHKEVPYSVIITVEAIKNIKGVMHIDAVIWVERIGQKGIIIGKNGEKLKEIGRQARIDLEKLFGCKVFLSLWVKVKKDWTGDEIALKDFGIK